jgi:hypothetical protein
MARVARLFALLARGVGRRAGGTVGLVVSVAYLSLRRIICRTT